MPPDAQLPLQVAEVTDFHPAQGAGAGRAGIADTDVQREYRRALLDRLGLPDEDRDLLKARLGEQLVIVRYEDMIDDLESWKSICMLECFFKIFY
mgnify:CR=1 FL=1